MSRIQRGLVLALVHLALIAGLGAKMLFDRVRLPRAWVLTVPYDPDLPIRGRYARLRLSLPARGFPQDELAYGFWADLRVEDGRVVAVRTEDTHGKTRVRIENGDPSRIRVQTPVPFFIPEHVPDPSIRVEGEELWVEVTIPRQGAPRPIRLGVKKGDGPIEPLALD